MIQRLIITIFVFLICFSAFSQSARIEVLAGSNISTVFNSIAKYKTGVTLTNYTRIGISVDEGPDDYKEWSLTIHAEDLAADGFNGTTGNTVPLDQVEITTSIIGGCAECREPYNPIKWKLTNVPEVILDGNLSMGADDITPALLYPYNFAVDQFAITYYFGVPPNTTMFSFTPDFYSEVIVLTLTMID